MWAVLIQEALPSNVHLAHFFTSVRCLLKSHLSGRFTQSTHLNFTTTVLCLQSPYHYLTIHLFCIFILFIACLPDMHKSSKEAGSFICLFTVFPQYLKDSVEHVRDSVYLLRDLFFFLNEGWEMKENCKLCTLYFLIFYFLIIVYKFVINFWRNLYKLNNQNDTEVMDLKTLGKKKSCLPISHDWHRHSDTESDICSFFLQNHCTHTVLSEREGHHQRHQQPRQWSHGGCVACVAFVLCCIMQFWQIRPKEERARCQGNFVCMGIYHFPFWKAGHQPSETQCLHSNVTTLSWAFEEVHIPFPFSCYFCLNIQIVESR